MPGGPMAPNFFPVSFDINVSPIFSIVLAIFLCFPFKYLFCPIWIQFLITLRAKKPNEDIIIQT